MERDSIDEEEYRKIDIPESSVWFPTVEIYHPKITKQEWIDLLHDGTIFTENSLITFACLQNATESSCTSMAKEFGRPKNFYNRNISSTGQRIYRKILCPLLDSKKQFWAICCFIKKLKNNHYVFKIRDELQQAFDETQILRDVALMAKNDQEKILNELVEKLNKEKYCDGGIRDSDFVWIGTKDGLIGNTTCHYEFIFEKKILYVDTHFEDEHFSKFEKVGLNRGLKHIDWSDENEKKDAIRFNTAPNGINIDDSKIVENALNLLDKMEEEIGEELRKILMNINNNQTTEIVNLLKNNKNLILYGAPGTGKTYLAKQIALKMIFPDCAFSVDDLDGNRMSAEQINFFNSHYKMVQFHPSYDYTDFVEGLRPVGNDENGNMRFERKDGAFKEFCKNALKTKKENLMDSNFDEAWKKLVEYIDANGFILVSNLSSKNSFSFSKYEEENQGDWVSYNSKFFNKEQLYNVYRGMPGSPAGNYDSYRKAIIKLMKEKFGLNDYSCEQKNLKSLTQNSNSTPFIFHIDEINRGEVSRIFGELFFCVEPSYRGEKGLIQTQYQNLVKDGDTFKNGFFIPKNIYIIGTMNDIDRSVDTLDFAFRRRFLFREITAAQSAQNMRIVGLALQRMSALNEAISDSKIGGLNSSFHIGASYFSDFNSDNADFLELWNCKLEGLLREYLRGEDDVEEKIEMLHTAFDLKNSMEKN